MTHPHSRSEDLEHWVGSHWGTMAPQELHHVAEVRYNLSKLLHSRHLLRGLFLLQWI